MSKQSRRVSQKLAARAKRVAKGTFKKGRAGANPIALKAGEYPATSPTAKSKKNNQGGWRYRI